MSTVVTFLSASEFQTEGPKRDRERNHLSSCDYTMAVLGGGYLPWSEKNEKESTAIVRHKRAKRV